jgi:2-polyprenyl-3-methyl-5-hydroxy-6-metoxy-1,4-benzoquinol methylase
MIYYNVNNIIYQDEKDHFENGVLRLLSLTSIEFMKWIEFSSESNQATLLSQLYSGFNKLKNINNFKSNTNFGLIDINTEKSSDYKYLKLNDIALLVKFDGNKFIRETKPPVYEEAYFEGDQQVAGGYGKYLEQERWRSEKANRQVDNLQKITTLTSGTVLDIGSGYGYFRKALEQSNYQHVGIEVSKHACNICKSLYVFDTYNGILNDYVNIFQNKFDIVTLWDVIEHIPDPIQFLSEINSVLKPGGYVVIKTPNINCIEFKLFTSYYHSLKREHLTLFSNNSLIDYGKQADLHYHYSTSISHLLKGFFDDNTIHNWENSFQGSDLIMYLKKNI